MEGSESVQLIMNRIRKAKKEKLAKILLFRRNTLGVVVILERNPHCLGLLFFFSYLQDLHTVYA
jgi:hypothetical protein